jgi:glycerol-3-phosphate acyltransferase PlsY
MAGLEVGVRGVLRASSGGRGWREVAQGVGSLMLLLLLLLLLMLLMLLLMLLRRRIRAVSAAFASGLQHGVVLIDQFDCALDLGLFQANLPQGFPDFLADMEVFVFRNGRVVASAFLLVPL